MHLKLIGFCAAALLSSAPAWAEAPVQTYQNLLTPLIAGGTDVVGSPLEYPEGPVNITSAIVTIPAGGETGWHLHEVPLFAHILEGELTVDYGEKGTKVFRAGESVFEAVNWPHNGTNTGTGPVRILAVYMGGGEARNTVTLPRPQ
ncbi:MAG: cupin domain-containing protein [Devosia sp.]